MAEEECSKRYPLSFILLALYATVSMLFVSKTLWGSLWESLWESTEPTSAHGSFDNPTSIQYEQHQSLPQGCLSLDFDGDMDHLLQKYKQVYLVATPKAAGTTFIHFARECMATKRSTINWEYDVLLFEDKMESVFRSELQVPSLLASHANAPIDVCTVTQHATKDSLIVFSHREETDRLMSAIKHVVTSRFCYPIEERDVTGLSRFKKIGNENECQVQETELMKLIKSRYAETTTRPLAKNCKAYNCIKENRPNFVIMNYKQAGKLQELISKHHCPEFKEEVKWNVAAEKKNVTVLLEHIVGAAGSSKNGTLLALEDWIHAKREILETALRLKTEVTCQGRTRAIEDALSACPDESLLLSGQSYQGHEYTKPFPF